MKNDPSLQLSVGKTLFHWFELGLPINDEIFRAPETFHLTESFQTYYSHREQFLKSALAWMWASRYVADGKLPRDVALLIAQIVFDAKDAGI